MVEYGRVFPDKKSYFPIWFLIFPILFTQFQIIIFFYVIDDGYGYANFVILLLSILIIDLIAVLRWYWWKMDPSFSSSSSSKRLIDTMTKEKSINFLSLNIDKTTRC